MSVYLDTTEYPNADLADVGDLKNYGYGSLESVPMQGIVTGATSLLTAAITSVATSLVVSDASRYPATPFVIQIGAERMNVTNKVGTTFTVTRGYDSTAAAAHVANMTVFEVLTEYIYLVNDGPVKAIDRVVIDGFVQSASAYTAYTGQAGDSHTDFAGVAVVAFAAESYIGKQYNLTAADAAYAGTLVGGRIDYASDIEFSNDDDESIALDSSVSTWGKTVGIKGAGVKTQAWVKFKSGNGTIKTQKYYIDVENKSTDEDPIKVNVLVTEGDGLKLREPFIVAPLATATLEVSRDGGIFDDVLRLVSQSSDLLIKDMRKETFVRITGAEADTTIIETQEVPNENQIIQSSPTRFASYPSTALGTEIIKQTHFVELVDASGDDSIKMLRLSAVEKDGTLLRTKAFDIDGSSTFRASISHDAGGWDAYTVVSINDVPVSKIQNLKIKKSIQYTIATALSVTVPLSTSSARIVVGSVISVDADFAIDTTGDFGGIGSLIERPDNVIKHFLINLYEDYVLADIDTTSFSAAGSFFTTNNYVFAGLVTNETPEILAFQCRSIIRHKEKWYLDIIPAAAPAENEIIDAGDLAGETALFKYSTDPINQIENDLTGAYKKDQSGPGKYLRIVSDADATSKTKYGIYEKRYEFTFISDPVTAADVLAQILVQNKTPMLYVEFPITHNNFDLRPGDTVKLTDTLFNNKKYFIEEIRQSGPEHIKIIKGREWAA